MIGAAQPVFLDEAVEQRGPAVAALFRQQAEPSSSVAKQQEILAEQAEPLFRPFGRELGGRADRMPIAA
jgi:hypothetical protein